MPADDRGSTAPSSALSALERFVRRHPDLEPATRLVLEAGATARAAAREAKAVAASRRSGQAVRQRASWARLEDAVSALEERSVETHPDRRRERTLEAARALVAAALELRAENLADAAAESISTSGLIELRKAVARFQASLAMLERRAKASGVRRLPWQLALASIADPTSPPDEIAAAGDDLVTPLAGGGFSGERCFLTGRPFSSDDGARPVRYRSLDSVAHVLAPETHALLSRARLALDAVRAECPLAAETVARGLPVVYEEAIEEDRHPSLRRVGLLDHPSQAVSLHNMLRTYGARPLFGSRGGPGAFPELGAADPVEVALGAGSPGYAWRTYDEVRLLAWRFAHGLEREGLTAGDKAALLVAGNRLEFYVADFACVFAGLVSVGLPAMLAPGELAAALERTEPSVLVTDRASLERALAAGVGADPRSLRLIVALDAVPAGLDVAAGLPRLRSYRDLLGPGAPPPFWTAASGLAPATGVTHANEMGDDATAGLSADDDGDLYTIIFTSGSTGSPKGVPITRRRWIDDMCTPVDVWPHVVASFQPSALAADRGAVWRAVYNGGRVGFSRGGAELFHDLRAIRPTLLEAPPVVWNTLYSQYGAAIHDPSLRRFEAAAAKERLRQAVGGRLVFAATGGAPTDPGMLRALEAAIGVHITDGYGATEVGHIAADGVLLPDVEFRLVDRPELGYTSSDLPRPRGELAVRGSRSTARYHGDATATLEAFDEDGFFLTGDLVELGPGRRLRILGRRRNLFKAASGEFVSPESLEACYLESRLVEAMVILGAGNGVVAVVVPSREGIASPDVMADFRAIARREGLRPVDVPAAVIVAPRVEGSTPWTVENGLLTPSSKVDRRAIQQRYREHIAQTSSDLARGRGSAPHPDRLKPADDLSTRAAVVELVAAILEIEPGRVDLERSFLDQGGDSLTGLEFVCRIEDLASGRRPPRHWVEEGPTAIVAVPLGAVVRDLAGLRSLRAEAPEERAPEPPSVTAGRAAGPEPDAPPPRPSGAADSGLALATSDAEDVPTSDPDLAPAAGHDVLVSGANGFLGVHLVAHLAAVLPRNGRVWAMVRADGAPAARARLEDALRAAGLEGTPVASEPGGGARVIAVPVALDQPRCGLDRGAWGELAREVALILHAAAEVSGVKSYAELRGANVIGTRALLELACTTRLKAFHLVSSLNVALLLQAIGRRPVDEETALPPTLSAEIFAASSGYAVSKWAAERMVETWRGRCGADARASISRPALLSWSTRTGFANPRDWLTQALISCSRMGAVIGPAESGILRTAPESVVSPRGFDLVPVDYAARSIARLGQLTSQRRLPSGSAPGRLPTFHVSNTTPGAAGLVTVERLMDLLSAAHLAASAATPGRGSLPLERLPWSRWLLRVERESAPAAAFLNELRRARPMERFAAQRFIAAMADDPGGQCPPIDRELLATFVRRQLAAEGATPPAGRSSRERTAS
jgi:fatty acid CoA ligase FadD9